MVLLSTGVESLQWSQWMTLAAAAAAAPRLPGVYEARIAGLDDVIYVGMAGERSRNGKATPKGLHARIKGYDSGRVLTNGLGRAVVSRALRDSDFRQQIADTDIVDVFHFGKLAYAYVNVEIRWLVTADKEAANVLENQLLSEHPNLWNRRPARTPKVVAIDDSL